MKRETWIQLVLVGGPVLSLIGYWLSLRGVRRRERDED